MFVKSDSRNPLVFHCVDTYGISIILKYLLYLKFCSLSDNCIIVIILIIMFEAIKYHLRMVA